MNKWMSMAKEAVQHLRDIVELLQENHELLLQLVEQEQQNRVQSLTIQAGKPVVR